MMTVVLFVSNWKCQPSITIIASFSLTEEECLFWYVNSSRKATTRLLSIAEYQKEEGADVVEDGEESPGVDTKPVDQGEAGRCL